MPVSETCLTPLWANLAFLFSEIMFLGIFRACRIGPSPFIEGLKDRNRFLTVHQLTGGGAEVMQSTMSWA